MKHVGVLFIANPLQQSISPGPGVVRSTSGDVWDQKGKPVCWSYAANTILRGNIPACTKIPSEYLVDPGSKETTMTLGLIRGLRQVPGLENCGITEEGWYNLGDNWASKSTTDEPWGNVFGDCLVKDFGAYWSTRDFGAVLEKLPTCSEPIEIPSDRKFRRGKLSDIILGPMNVGSEPLVTWRQNGILDDMNDLTAYLNGKFKDLFDPSKLFADGGGETKICPFGPSQEVFVIDTQWAYENVRGGLDAQGQRHDRAAFRKRDELEKYVAPYYDNDCEKAQKKLIGHSMALVGKILVKFNKEQERTYVVIKNSAGKVSMEQHIDDCLIAYGFIICPEDKIFKYTRIEKVQVLRSKSSTPNLINKDTSPRPSLCYAILAENIDLVKEAFLYEKDVITFGSRLCEGSQAMDFFKHLKRTRSKENQLAIADWLAVEEARRLVAGGHMGRKLCDMMIGEAADGDPRNKRYLPHIFERSHFRYQKIPIGKKDDSAMHVLLNHVSAECPPAIHLFFAKDNFSQQCTMLMRMALAGQNDAFVQFVRLGYGTESCLSSRKYLHGKEPSGDATNAVARSN